MECTTHIRLDCSVSFSRVKTKMAQLSFIVTLISIALYVLAEELYTDQYDYIDINNILNNDKLREQYYNCYMETGPCLTADARYFRGISFYLFIYRIFNLYIQKYNVFFLIINSLVM